MLIHGYPSAVTAVSYGLSIAQLYTFVNSGNVNLYNSFTVTHGIIACRYAVYKNPPRTMHRSGKYSAYRLLAEVFLFNKSYTVVDKHLRCLLNVFDTDNDIRSACNLTHYGVHILNVYSAGIYLAHNVI